MQQLKLSIQQGHKLTPQQLQYIRLLQLPAKTVGDYIEQELAENPALEEAEESAELSPPWPRRARHASQESQTPWEQLLGEQPSWHDHLLSQLQLLFLSPHEERIARQVIGSLDQRGYLPKSADLLAEELTLLEACPTTLAQVERLIQRLQGLLDPPGVGARNLQENLLIQLHRAPQDAVTQQAIQVVEKGFKELIKKDYQALAQKTQATSREEMKRILERIARLSPAPFALGKGKETAAEERWQPDFLVQATWDQLTVTLVKERWPALRVGQHYKKMIATYTKRQDEEAHAAVAFAKEHILRAQYFIAAIQQRQQTLLRTMQAIVDLQRPFFEQGDPKLLRPIFLRDVAEVIGMDISTVSRVVRGRAVQTSWKLYPLRYFFSEAIPTQEGGSVSSRVVKQALVTLIAQEDKQAPYTDGALTEALHAQGYMIARRTVAKYREQLGFLIASKRKEKW